MNQLMLDIFQDEIRHNFSKRTYDEIRALVEDGYVSINHEANGFVYCETTHKGIEYVTNVIGAS